MSEEVNGMRDGSFLCVNKKGKAYWGQPEGYPCEIKSVIEFDADGSKDYTISDGFTKISDATPADLVGSKLTVRINAGGELIDVDGSLTGSISMGAGITVYAFKGNDGTVPDAPLIAIIDSSNTKGYETGTFVLTAGGIAKGILTMIEKQPISPYYLPAATNLTLGAVRQAIAVSEVTGDTVPVEKFNELLDVLKAAGIMAYTI